MYEIVNVSNSKSVGEGTEMCAYVGIESVWHDTAALRFVCLRSGGSLGIRGVFQFCVWLVQLVFETFEMLS